MAKKVKTAGMNTSKKPFGKPFDGAGKKNPFAAKVGGSANGKQPSFFKK